MASGVEWLRPKLVDATGAFDLGRARPGEYSLSLTRGSGGFAASALVTRTITVKTGEAVFVDLNIRTGRLAGSVVDDANKPIGGARVRANQKGQSRGFGRGLNAMTDANGKFSVEDVAEGSYMASASLEDLMSEEVPVDVAGGGSGNVVIQLRPGNTVEGTFEAPNLPNNTRWAALAFTPKKKDGDPSAPGAANTASVDLEQRAFTAKRLQAGSYQVTLRAFGDDGGPKSYKPLDFDVPPGGARGVLLRFEERPPGESDDGFPFGPKRR
jgi:hypothetical protein